MEGDRGALADGMRMVTERNGQPTGPWQCFHCWEVFTDPAAASLHFGETPSLRPACLIDIVEYRRMENLRWKYGMTEEEQRQAVEEDGL